MKPKSIKMDEEEIRKEIDEYQRLIRMGKKYIQNTSTTTGLTIKRWQNKAMRWLERNLPDTGLSIGFLTASAIRTDNYYLNGRDNSKINKKLKVLLKAEGLLPYLKQDSNPKKIDLKNINKVFIVHGHNDLLKDKTARIIEKLGLNPIILHEQPNNGRTIIEKFIDYSEVGFAVVLLTPDDRGGLANQEYKDQKYRARQNVILELGFFIGKLGREKVCALYYGDIEIPSDYSGILFLKIDDGGAWALQLAKEIKSSGIGVDLNRIV